MNNQLEINNLHVSREGREVVHGVSLTVPAGRLVALLGPNGSGKSSLVSAVMGHPSFEVTEGEVRLDGESVVGRPADERARLGLFLSLQHPPEVPGVTVGSFLRAAWSAVSAESVGMAAFRERLVRLLTEVGLDPSFLGRGLNEGFSGGERKRLEMLQLALLEPRYALLDETDSGLDVDALKTIGAGISAALARGAGVLIITHNPKVLEVVKPDAVLVLCSGRVVASGGPELATKIAEQGYCGVACADCN
jgi:Fe-S cluster assembly ATP-binding protein